MSKWFRLNTDAVRHPKVTQLSDSDFRLWINLLSVAAENGGSLYDERHLSKVLSIRVDYLLARLQRLARIGLVDIIDGGFIPHDWNDYQMKSYSSAERMKRHRAKSNVTVTLSTNTNTIKEKDIEKEKSALRAEKQSSQKKVSRRSQLEEDDYPDDREVEIATRAGMSALTIDHEWERFRSHHIAKGSLMANWTQAWVTWTTNWKSFGSKQAKGSSDYAFEKNGTKANWRH